MAKKTPKKSAKPSKKKMPKTAATTKSHAATAPRKSAQKRPAVAPKAKPVAASAGVKKPVAVSKEIPKAVPGKGKSSVDRKSLDSLRDILIRMRERLTGQISALSDDSLKYIDDQSSEDRTDDFDREFALNLVSSEHDAIFEIDEALRRIKERSYGRCVECGSSIEKARLQALPFARLCIKCQSETERGRSRYRPFGETIAQGAEPVQEAPEAEETE